MDVNLSTTAIGTLLYKWPDTNVDRNQPGYRHQKRQAAPSGGNAATSKKTSAEKLIDYLENVDNISYVILLDNAEEGRVRDFDQKPCRACQRVYSNCL